MTMKGCRVTGLSALRSMLVIGALVLGAGVWQGGAEIAFAQSVLPQDLDDIARLSATQGRSAEEVKPLVDLATKAGERGLPPGPLVNKIKEGLAKGIDPKRIEPVLREMAGRLATAQETLKELSGRGLVDAGSGGRQRAVEVLAEALARGASPDEVRQIGRLAQEGKPRLTPDALASGAKSLAVMKEGGVPAREGLSLVADALRQGFRPSELADLSRELKRRGREGRLPLQAVQDAVKRGDRPDHIFREDRRGPGGGDRLDRSERGARLREDRGSRGDGRPDRLEHLERPERIDRSGPSERPERPERPDRSGSGR
ncbi:MAG: hypothetical protein KatS3mg082_2065 [Nitrospiraceae bacterium]|nr:MAG: hypothetical protein KatS3mg082_2065 [Nitrospiraceae bacterium]